MKNKVYYDLEGNISTKAHVEAQVETMEKLRNEFFSACGISADLLGTALVTGIGCKITEDSSIVFKKIWDNEKT